MTRNLKRDAWTRPRPFDGWFVIPGLGLVMFNLCTKFKFVPSPVTKTGKRRKM